MSSQGYAISECRDLINKKFEEDGMKVSIRNRDIKDYLQKKFGYEIGFCSAHQKSDSEMFFSTQISKGDLVGKIRSTDVVSECAKMLRNESKDYNFRLDSSYCDGNDVSVSNDLFKENRPPLWDKFTSYFVDQVSISDEKQRVCDTVFQILHKMVHNNQRRTPVSVSLAESISELGRSKHLITIGCRLGICSSYDELQRIDTGIIGRTIDLTGDCRVPVPPHIDSDSIIHGATDNFDHNDCHHSILMLFQNSPDEKQLNDSISYRPGTTSSRERKLLTALPCQTLIDVQKGHKRGSIPPNYATSLSNSESKSESTKLIDLDVWNFARYSCKERFSTYFK